MIRNWAFFKINPNDNFKRWKYFINSILIESEQHDTVEVEGITGKPTHSIEQPTNLIIDLYTWDGLSITCDFLVHQYKKSGSGTVIGGS